MASSGTILSDAIQAIIDRLASPDVVNFFQRSRLDAPLVNDLKSLMLAAVNAEEKPASDPAVRKWLDDLKQCLIQTEEIANEITTKALKPGLPSEPGPSEIKSRSGSYSFQDATMMKIKEVKRMIETMLNQKNDLGLGHDYFSRALTTVPTTTTYMVGDSIVFGRERERDEIRGLLLSEGAERNKIDVITIVGMAGIGKTTLAKMVYNDARVKDTFDLQAWVLVTDKPDVSRVTKSILESVSDQTYSGSPDLNLLQSSLSTKVTDKRFLLVLDDVWGVDNEIWNVLRASLFVAANGSKIILTTRDPKVASALCTVPMFCVKPLSKDDSWSLFSRHAFEVGNTTFDTQLDLIARNILRKCQGLPLVIKTLGAMLRSTQDFQKWKAILHCNLWDLPYNEIKVKPPLMLYPHLPTHLKPHTSYCSLLPEDLEFTKKRLVRRWIDGDFIVQTKRGIEHPMFSNSGKVHNLIHDPALGVAAVPPEELAFDDTSRSRSTLEGSLQLADTSTRPSTKYLKDLGLQIKYMFHVLRQNEGGQTNQTDAFMNKSAREIKSHKNTQEQCREYSRRPKDLVGRPRESLDCLVYCTLFPKDYELEGHTLIQLWMAAGLIQEEPMEDIATTYLRALAQLEDIISLSRVDYGAGKSWYKFCQQIKLSQRLRDLSRLRLVTMDDCDNDPSAISKTDSPCHVIVQGSPTNYTLQVLGTFPQIRAVLLLQGDMSNIDCLPYNFFISLEFLQALDLSGTKLLELPSSIGDARCLRYLDLSDTPIKQLPETMDSLEKLQTLKLRNCAHLNSLPKGTRQLTSLRHLDLGTLCCLDSMPPEMGALTRLRTLSNFVVGEEPGCRIAELKHMNDLRGRLCLSNLEYVASPDEAKEANLSHKQRLTNLELRWTTEDDAEEEVIEHLQPHKNLQDLRILCYGGSKFPRWISNPCFDTLVRITLFRCENCQVLPSLGQLPGLEVLSLIELPGVKIIDFHFGRDVSSTEGENFVAFPNLQKLTIKSMASLKEWRDMGEHDFPQLTKLRVKDCPELVALCRLSNFHSLQHLEINRCSNLWDFPGDLPASVKKVVIGKCPLLSLRCLEQDEKDWQKTEGSPAVMMYQRDEDS